MWSCCVQIIVHGTKEATSSLANYCRSARDIVQGRVFEPSLNEVIDATTESHIYQVSACCRSHIYQVSACCRSHIYQVSACCISHIYQVSACCRNHIYQVSACCRSGLVIYIFVACLVSLDIYIICIYYYCYIICSWRLADLYFHMFICFKHLKMVLFKFTASHKCFIIIFF